MLKGLKRLDFCLALSTQHSALSTQPLNTQHSALSTQHSALSTQPLSTLHNWKSFIAS
ncbi:hypothetical protein [Nostoc sp. DedQUE09]|uniref:hypothetical protein n=1 Tax=Nostoc sp. DedQUE09 TaxID=3075394 RepID=UPI002AD2F139|nr:hypothetical protein [Nostoc sp. DedQUE09]